MLLEKIKAILKEEDILGLISMGAPDDEYDGEARRFFERYKKDSSQEDIEKLIKDIFIEMFWEKYIARRDFSTLGRRLYEELKDG